MINVHSYVFRVILIDRQELRGSLRLPHTYLRGNNIKRERVAAVSQNVKSKRPDVASGAP